MQSIFADPLDGKEFSEIGFIRKQVLHADQVQKLNHIYRSHFPGGTEKFFSSTFINDLKVKRGISDQLTKLLVPSLEGYFRNYKVLGSQFLIKNPGSSGLMPFHQDWTAVDEEKYRSLTIWIGLHEINETNGALRVFPKSHLFSKDARGPGNFDRLRDIQNILDEKSETLMLASGEALIFDHALIHGSGINSSDQARIAVAMGLVHKDAEMCFFHRKGADKFEKYEVADDFFITFPNDGNAPQGGKLLQVLPHAFESIKSIDFTDRMQELSKIENSPHQVLPLFLDSELQIKFEKDGYVKVDLLNSDEVKVLRDFYDSLKKEPVGEYGFHISLENKSPEYINAVFKKLFDTIIPKLDPLLVNYKAFTASYVIKETGVNNIVPPHQDWSFVDEEKYCSATVWIPLVEVSKKNGALGVIRGSHRIFNYPRASPSPQARTILSNHAFNLFPYVKIIEMKAGEALIFNNRTVHASPPNISGETRLAAGIGITQKDAQLLHYFQQPGKGEKIDVFKVDETFFPTYNNSILSVLFDKGEGPGGYKKLKTFTKETPVLSKEEITQKLSSIEGVKFDQVLAQELAGLYNYNPDGTPKKNSAQTNKKIEIMSESKTTPKANEAPADKSEASQQVQQPFVDNRTFFQKYTPANIIAEIKYRLKKK